MLLFPDRDLQNNESKQVPWDILQGTKFSRFSQQQLRLFKDPQEYVNHFERYAASVVSIIGFGRRLQTWRDPVVTQVIYSMQLAAALNVPVGL